LLLRIVPALALIFALLPITAFAQIGSARYSSIVVDARTGDVLEAVNADAPRHPASLAKLMTLYMAFEALRDRRIAFNDLVPISAHAASMEPSKLGLLPRTRITVEQIVLGLVTKSANDAAAALGEFLGGSEDRFAQMMTLRARALGMNHTTFTNASGLPDPDQWTTARDLAILSRRLIADFPGYYRFFSTPSFVWQGRTIFNHDTMLKSYPGADGMKTGYTDSSGHNLITSAVRGGVRLIGVVLGAGSNGQRDIHMASLLNGGFDQMDVPVDRHPVQTASRGGLIASAHAATISTTTRPVSTRTHESSQGWSIRIGSYSTQRAARGAAAIGRRAADGGETRTEAVTVRHKTLWRALVVGLSGSDARDACAALAKRKTPCAMFRLEAEQGTKASG
jgi:D-alanyl-D-alanine carboxypeptidase